MGLWSSLRPKLSPSLSSGAGPERIDDADGRGDDLGLSIWAYPRNGTEPVVDIIFVHGLTGKKASTWRAKGELEPWPKTMLAQQFPQARILAFGYDADLARMGESASLNTVSEHATNLLNGIQGKRQDVRFPIFFVGHSLGGLVIQRALVLADSDPEDYNQDIVCATQAIMFFGTPHSGSDWAFLAKGLVDLINMSFVKQANKEVVDILHRDSGQLADLQTAFSNLNERRARGRVTGVQKIALHCFTEGQSIRVGRFERRIVKPESAKHVGYHTGGTIDADHMQMTKFKSRQDPGFEAVCLKFRQWMRPSGSQEAGTASAVVGTGPSISTPQLESTQVAAAAELDARNQNIPPSYPVPSRSAFYLLDYSARYYRVQGVRHYWDHLTIPAYEVYESMYETLRRSSDGFVYLLDFQRVFDGHNPSPAQVKNIWGRLGASSRHRVSKSYILAMLYILHIGPKPPAQTFSAKPYSSETMMQLSRFAKWVECSCQAGGCGQVWNFANSIYGLRRGDLRGGASFCPASAWYDEDRRREPTADIWAVWTLNKDKWWNPPEQQPRLQEERRS